MQRLLCFLLISLFLSGSFRINAQSKPKRDVSKDKTALVAKQSKKAKKKETKTVAPKSVSNNRNVSVVNNTPKYATYLRVNQSTAIDKSIDSNGGSESFYINTDGNSWNVNSLPSWCHINKNTNSFTITYDANPSHDERSDWFLVSSDDQIVRVNLKQTGVPMNVWAYFHYGQLRHNVIFPANGYAEKCLNICANVSIKGAKGQKIIIRAFIEDEQGNSITAYYGYYKFALAATREVCASMEIIPNTDEAESYFVNIYLPNKTMYLQKKNNKLRCKLAVFCVKTDSYVSSYYTLKFKAKNKKREIITKDY